MNKKQQIEEMLLDVPQKIVAYDGNPAGQHLYGEQRQEIAEALYNAGDRVVPENAVILTPEERDEEMKEIARLNRVETELQELYIKYYNEAKDLRREVAELKAENEKRLKANEDFATK